MPEILTQAQLDSFRRDGFIAPVDGVTPEQAQGALDRIEAYERETGQEASRSIRVRAVLVLRCLYDLVQSPRVIGALRDVLGPNVGLYLSGVWSKMPGGGKFVSWHQDGAYYAFDRHVSVTAWLALTDSTAEKGCVKVIPGSHRDPVHAHDETYDPDNLLSRGQSIRDVDPTKAVDMELRAGQFSIHHEMVVHGSTANLGDGRRIGISFSCIPTEVKALEGPQSILLLSGENLPGHWALDPAPRHDFDPLSMAALVRAQDAYRNPAFRNEEERGRRREA
jgi:chlorinating enzyme